MPLIKPKDNEEKDDFLKRCMGNDTMLDEFPDNKQRYAVCNQIWRDKDKSSIDIKTKKKKLFLEARSFPLEVRIMDEENTPKITGYAAIFNQLSNDLGGFREKIKKGFFSSVLENDVRALFNHDENMVLGRTKNNTLVLEEDNKGLKIEIVPPDTSYAKDLMNLIKRGDVDQMSFQWITEKDEWDSSDLNNVVRTLIKAQSLYDISPVTFPAYPQTKVAVRSAKEVYINYLEELLEDNSDNDKGKEDTKWHERICIARMKLDLLEKENE